MRSWILTTTQFLLPQQDYSSGEIALTLDEVAACAGISLAHLRAYYTSVYAILADLRDSHESRPAQVSFTASGY